MRSRKRALGLFLGMTLACILVYFAPFAKSLGLFYAICFALGLSIGYWAMFVTVASELFGTNLRATATTTAPNFVRGAVVPVTLLFQALREPLGLSAGRPHGWPADGDDCRRGAVGAGRDLRSRPRLRRGL